MIDGNILESAWAKAIAGVAGAVWGASVSFVLPVSGSLILTSFAVFVNFISGWIASGSPFSPARFRYSLWKWGGYMAILLLAHGIDVVYLKGGSIVAYASGGAIGFTEFFSVVRNVDRCSGTNLVAKIRGALGKGGK